jgi:hypothetical protein
MPELLLDYREMDAIGHGLLEAETDQNMPDVPNLRQGFRSINLLLSTWRRFRTSIFSCQPSPKKYGIQCLHPRFPDHATSSQLPSLALVVTQGSLWQLSREQAKNKSPT